MFQGPGNVSGKQIPNRDQPVALSPPAAEEILVLADNLENLAIRIADLAQCRMARYTQKHAVVPETEMAPLPRELPPYWHDLRGRLFGIEQSLQRIEESIGRADI